MLRTETMDVLGRSARSTDRSRLKPAPQNQDTGARGALVGEPEADDGQNRFHAILPGDFFALFVAAAVVGDADFEDANSGAELGDFSGDFGLEAEAVTFDL